MQVVYGYVKNQKEFLVVNLILQQNKIREIPFLSIYSIERNN